MMEDKDESLEVNMITSIATSEFKDVSIDFSEIGIDLFLDEGILKDIPIIGSIAKLYSGGVTIKEKIFEKKVIEFLYHLDHFASNEKVQFVLRIKEDKKFERKVGEHLLIVLDRIDDINKTKILAKLFASYISSKIEYDLFLRFSSIMDKIFLPDLNKLPLYRKISSSEDSFVSSSLESQGLVYASVIGGDGNKYSITELGELLLKTLEN